MYLYHAPKQRWRKQIARDTRALNVGEGLLDAYQQGLPVPVLARRLQRPEASIGRALNRARARQLREQPITYVYHASFEDPALEQDILRLMPGWEEYQLKPSRRIPVESSADSVQFDAAPLLTREQEAHLFRQMNYLKHRASQLLAQIDVARPRGTDLDQIEQWLRQAAEIRHLLVRANLRLVVSATKKYAYAGANLGERLSEGCLPLLRAIEKFDFSRGFKFSTYATWAITNETIRSRPAELVTQARFQTGHDDLFDIAPNQRSDERAVVASARQAQQTVHRLLARLDNREKRIVRLRAGIDAPQRLTLAEIGNQLGISKERVRQIERGAMQKLRKLTEEERIELPE